MKKTGAYGDSAQEGGDTGFRRKFSTTDYNQQTEQQRQQKGEKKGKSKDAIMEVSNVRRPDELNFESVVNQKRIVHTTVRQVGFKCAVCRLTFKDNLSLLEHLTSRDHLTKTGVDPTRKATLQEVLDKLDELRALKRREDELRAKDASKLLNERIDQKELLKLEMRAEKKQKLKQKIQEKKQKQQEESGGDQDNEGLMAMMGFQGFGTSKKN